MSSSRIDPADFPYLPKSMQRCELALLIADRDEALAKLARAERTLRLPHWHKNPAAYWIERAVEEERRADSEQIRARWAEASLGQVREYAEEVVKQKPLGANESARLVAREILSLLSDPQQDREDTG